MTVKPSVPVTLIQHTMTCLGDVISLRVPGKTIVVLASEKAASDLLEKRSAIYSDRARLGIYDQ